MGSISRSEGQNMKLLGCNVYVYSRASKVECVYGC